MKREKISAKPISILITAIVASWCSAASANVKLEEILVTATKRIENKLDVATSIQSFDEAFLERMNVNKLEDIAAFTDNLHFTESGLSTQFRIRGIGSGNSQGFEQSVAQYVDGVHYGRAQLFRAPIYDVSNIEILRGSQNALFGKDSIAGGVVINTAPATSDFHGKIGIGYNPEFNRYEESIFINGAITDSLNARLSLHGLQDDGVFENTTEGGSTAERKEKSARLKFDWQATENFNFKAKLETGSFNSVGRGYEITQDIASPLSLDIIAQQPGNETLKAIPSTFNNIMTVLVNQPAFETKKDWKRQVNSAEASKNHINNITVDGIYNFSSYEWHTKVSHVNYGYDEPCDCDYTPANLFTLKLDESYSQNTIDSYIKNNDDSSGTRWLAGIFYQQSDLNFHDRFFVPADSVLAALGNPLPGTGADREFSQKSNTAALYGEVSFALTDNTDLIISGRYTHDEKDGKRSLTIVDQNNNPISNPAIACAYLYGVKADTVQSVGLPYDCGAATPNLNLGISPGHELYKSRSEGSFTPVVTLNHKFTENDSAFISVKSGHKSGGFDPRSNAAYSFEFDEEKAITGELGFRSLSDDGRFENGITFFKTTYDNLQVSQYDGALGFNVGNAKETESAGFEFDGRFLLSENLIINYSAAYIDIEYKDFRNGNCHQGQTPNGADVNGDGAADLCDYTGQRPVFVPETSGNIGAEYATNFASGELSYALNVQYTGKHNVHENADPKGIQDSYFMVNASIAYEIDSLVFRLVGNNLTNEYVKTYQGNVPLSGSNFGTNTFYTFAKPPRSFTATVEYRF